MGTGKQTGRSFSLNISPADNVEYRAVRKKKKPLTIAQLKKKWRKGGKKAAKNLTDEQKRARAQAAARARWKK